MVNKPILSFDPWIMNSMVINLCQYWFLLFIVAELKPLAIKTIEIIWMPIEQHETNNDSLCLISHKFMGHRERFMKYATLQE